MIPTTPFEAITCDYFHLNGCYYFVSADRLSGWLEVQQIKFGTNEAGAKGLLMALRRLMATEMVDPDLLLMKPKSSLKGGVFDIGYHRPSFPHPMGELN